MYAKVLVDACAVLSNNAMFADARVEWGRYCGLRPITQAAADVSPTGL